MTELRSVPLYRATTRTLMVLGAERELTLILMIFSGALVLTSISVAATILGTITWVCGLFLLRQLAKNDPQASKIFLRYWFRHRKQYYAAAARPSGDGYLPAKK